MQYMLRPMSRIMTQPVERLRGLFFGRNNDAIPM
ncbi:hypothetical protein N234_07945 [Ralstonia pickettii DTP0602]|nr:hypothetical protein N234_07945 [Ralstonia pickettii DTP0602]